MKASIAVEIVLCVLIGVCCLISPAQAKVERRWIGTDMDYTAGPVAGGYTDAYVRVSQGDILNLNWKSGSVLTSGEQLEMCIYTSTIAMSYDNFESESPNPGNGYNWKYNNLYEVGDSAPVSMWVRFGSFDVIRITVGRSITNDLTSNQVFNLTMNSSELPFTKDLSSNLTGLESSIANLSDNFTSRLNSLNDMLNDLRNYTFQLNLSFNQYINNILETVSLMNSNFLNEVSMLNDSMFDKINLLRSDFETEIDNLKDYEASRIFQLQDQINKLNSIPPTIEYNNTTIINQTVVNETIINQTFLNNTEFNEVRPMTFQNTTKTVEDKFAPTLRLIVALNTLIGIGCIFYCRYLGKSILDRKARKKS